MKTIVISPYSSKLHSGKRNAKDYAYFPELISLLKSQGYYVIQIGVTGEAKFDGVNEFKQNLSFPQLKELVSKPEVLVVSVDSFLPHMCHTVGVRCVVLWGKSDPNVFGYKENINILKDRTHLRNPFEQFVYWNEVEYDPTVFVEASEVVDYIGKVTMGII